MRDWHCSKVVGIDHAAGTSGYSWRTWSIGDPKPFKDGNASTANRFMAGSADSCIAAVDVASPWLPQDKPYRWMGNPFDCKNLWVEIQFELSIEIKDCIWYRYLKTLLQSGSMLFPVKRGTPPPNVASWTANSNSNSQRLLVASTNTAYSIVGNYRLWPWLLLVIIGSSPLYNAWLLVRY